jgi:peptidoglycan/xylan/chitin deacetylase (PgdA/CDA1 family)
MKLGGDKRAAISFTFDDGSRDQVEVALPIFEEFGFRVTFFVIAGLTRERTEDPLLPGRARPWWAEVSWQQWREVAERGHEIGNHSMTHVPGGLTRLRDAARLEHEIGGAARLIAEKLGRAPESFAYPFFRRNARVRAVVLRYHRFVREAGVRYGGPRFGLERANGWVDSAIRQRRWVVAVLHGVDGGYDAVDSGLLREHLAYIKRREAEILVDTFGAISRRGWPG